VIFERAVVEQFLPERSDEPEYVAHYTKLDTLLYLVKPGGVGSIRATGLRYLNDRHELGHGLRLLEAAIPPGEFRPLRAAFSQIGSVQQEIFQVSFSGNGDELGQWRGYANNGVGCSIEVDRAGIYSVASAAGWIIYEKDEQEKYAATLIQHLIDRKTDINDIATYLLAGASFMKHPGFFPEEEYRLLMLPQDPKNYEMRASGDRLAPYVEVIGPGVNPLRIGRIRLGPGWQLSNLKKEEQSRNHVVLGVQRLLERNGIRASVEPSEIPYDPR
jgi:hypothetical protein